MSESKKLGTPHEGFNETSIVEFIGYFDEYSKTAWGYMPDDDEVIGIVTMHSLRGAGRRNERLNRSDGLTSRLEGKDGAEAAKISTANGRYINESMANGLLRSAAKIVAKLFETGQFLDPAATKIKTVPDEYVEELRAYHESLRQAGLQQRCRAGRII